MNLLCWDKPKKKMSTKEWMMQLADSAPPGVYSPNMGEEDVVKWKAKLIKGEHPRVEIRKGLSSCLLVVVVLKDGYYPKDKRDERFCKMRKEDVYFTTRVRISANGPICMTAGEWVDLQQAVEEAKEALSE